MVDNGGPWTVQPSFQSAFDLKYNALGKVVLTDVATDLENGYFIEVFDCKMLP